MNFGFLSKRNRTLLLDVSNKKVQFAGLFITLTPGLATAAAWQLIPSVDLTETYTDNVELSTDSGSESDWISQINPTLSITGTGRELELAFDYRMQNIFYAGDSDRDTTNHQLNANMHATLAPRWLFLDASSSLSQQVLSPDDNVSVGNLGVVSGREDVLTTRVSPYLETLLSNKVLADIRFTHDSVSYSGGESDDSTAEQVNVSLKSAKAFGSWTWVVRYSEQDVKYSGQSLSPDREDVKRQDTVLDLGYQLSAKVQLTGQTGYEDNEYAVNTDSETPEGRYWSVGAVWAPSAQTTLSTSGGHRYFGRTWNVDWSHQARRNNWQLTYDENITSVRELQLEERFPSGLNSAGTPGVGFVTQALGTLNENVLVSTDEVFIDRRAHFQWTMDHRKSTTTFKANRSQKDFQESDETETTTGVDLGWDWRVSKTGEFNANAGHQKTERDTGNDRYNIISLGYEKQLGRRVSSSYDFRNVRRDTSGASNSYTENQLSAGLKMSW